MLVLTRKAQQSIHIGDNIKISVVRVRGNTIQLGIEAPKEVRVMRSELIERDGNHTHGSQASTRRSQANDPSKTNNPPPPINRDTAILSADLLTAF